MSEQPLDPIRGELAAAHAWLLALARGLASDPSRAEDLVQDAWALAARRGLAGARDWRAFLGGIVRVRARRERADERARAAREERGAEAERAVRGESTPSPAELAERLELARVVAEELAAMPAEQRTLLLLRYQEGVEPAAIARARGVPAGTVRAQLARARDALRERLDRRFQGRREGWAAIAAIPLARTGAPLTVGAAAGGLAMHAAVKIGLGLGAAAVLGWWAVRRAPAGAVAEPPIEPPSVALAPADGGATHRDAGSVPDESARAVIDAGAAPPASDAAPTSSDALDLHVIDARTREPLPQYAVALRAGETEEIVTTDANGVARIPRRWLDATFDLVALDDAEQRIPTRQERTIAPHELAAPSSPIVFEVLAGPTYRLLFVDPPPASGRLHVGLSIGTEPDRIRTHGRVREGSPPWTRLDPASASAAWLGEGPWTLSVRDVRGLWLASGPVHQIEGVQVEPVVLEGGARGALAVHATIDGAPIDHEITLGAYPFRDGRPHDDGKTPHVILGPPDRGFGHGRPGHATLDHLEPGRYMVWLASPSVRHHEEVEIRGGETTRIDVDLTRATDVAPLTVFVRSQTGRTSLSGLMVYGRHVGRPELDDIAHGVRQHADGTSEYRFDALAAGQWRIRVLYAGHIPPLERNDVLATAGGPAVELVCLDEGAPPRVRRRARVIDAFSRDAIPFAGVTTYVEGTRHFAQTAAADGTVELGPYTSDAHVVACVRAGDHRARFVEIDFDGDPEAVTDIALEPGWGTLIDVVEPSLEPGGKPLRGVQVTIDGLLAGTTDERGQLLVARDRRPATIELALEGYRLSHGDIDPTTHAPAEHLFPFFVVMSRAP